MNLFAMVTSSKHKASSQALAAPSASRDNPAYQAWPEPIIRKELEEFRKIMFNGAGPLELISGLLALDNLTHVSAMQPVTRHLVDATVNEARMRIDLMVAADTQVLAEAEARQASMLARVKSAHRSLSRVQQWIEAFMAVPVEDVRTQLDAHFARQREREAAVR
jgi:hypothetical protein